jgi:predicted Zn-dependent protease
MRDAFFALADALEATLRDDEALFARLEGEVSDFARLNHARLRQAGRVARHGLELELIHGRRHATAELDLTGSAQDDLAAGRAALDALRARLTRLPEDPHLNLSATPLTSAPAPAPEAPDPRVALTEITAAAEGLDLVGIWASGTQASGLTSSHGHRLWEEAASFNLDWSVYHAADKAAKASLAGRDWSASAFAQRLEGLRGDLAVLARAPRRLQPGRYRVYLAPQALIEVLDMMAWGGFGLKSHRTEQTPLIKMLREGRTLHPGVTLREAHAEGMTAGFTASGHTKPEAVTLIEGGAYRDCLTDARSAAEYGAEVNADGEYPDSLDLAAGGLPEARVLAELGTGLYVNNLWYLNFSDRSDCRITGMTRFACFWVEGGEVVAPVEVMRFDDSVYHILGDGLLGLTRERALILDPGTYGGRSRRSYRLPGALVDGLRLTL